jgi:3-dehydroquinate dehydratase-2
MSSKVLILNGPNLNMLGQREVEIYGGETLAEIEAACRSRAAGYAMEIDFRQSNGEAQLVDWIQEARGAVQGIIINAGAYTHTSIAILDALKMVDMPIIEVHLSNIYAREEFRQKSVVAPIARGQISGLGWRGYIAALRTMVAELRGTVWQ